MRNRRDRPMQNAVEKQEDDVRSSLDFLDSVINEFDESDTEKTKKSKVNDEIDGLFDELEKTFLPPTRHATDPLPVPPPSPPAMPPPAMPVKTKIHMKRQYPAERKPSVREERKPMRSESVKGSRPVGRERSLRDSKKPATEKKPMERRAVERKSLERRSMDRSVMERRSMERRSMERRSVERRSMERRSADRRSVERRPGGKAVIEHNVKPSLVREKSFVESNENRSMIREKSFADIPEKRSMVREKSFVEGNEKLHDGRVPFREKSFQSRSLSPQKNSGRKRSMEKDISRAIPSSHDRRRRNPQEFAELRRMTTSTQNLSEIPAVPHDAFVDRGRQFRGQRSATDINMVTRRSSRASSYQKNNDFRQDRELLRSMGRSREALFHPQPAPVPRDVRIVPQLEAHKEFLLRQGFSPTHPYITGEISIHPELQGQLPFKVANRTIPLKLEDYQRFRPEYWLQHQQQMGQERRYLEERSRRNKPRSKDKFAFPEKGYGFPNTPVIQDTERMIQNGHWLMREKGTEGLHSLPPTIDWSNKDLPRQLERLHVHRSSFGMALRDRFQRNPNMYFPGKGRPQPDEYSDESFEDDSSIGSIEMDTSSSTSPHNSMEGSVPTTPTQFAPPPSQASFNKKTIRNYTPKGSTDFLKEIESRRKLVEEKKNVTDDEKQTSVQKMIADFHRSLKHPLEDKSLPKKEPAIKHGSISMSSQVSNWSAASSTASFDFQPVKKPVSKKEPTERQMKQPNAKQVKEVRQSKESLPAKQGKPSKLPVAKPSGAKMTEKPKEVRNSGKPTANPPPPPPPKLPPPVDRQINQGNREGALQAFSIPPPPPMETSPTLNEKQKNQNRSKNEARRNNQLAKPVADKNARNKTGRKPSMNEKSRPASSELNKNPLKEPEKDSKELKKKDLDRASKDKNTPELEIEIDDEFSSLRKLISEGRIAGLNEKPPAFVPPSPPSKAEVRRRTKSPAPKPPVDHPPKPPMDQIPSSQVQFLSSRLRKSTEDLTDSKRPARRTPAARSKQNGGARLKSSVDAAQLIADSTEKRMNFNPFKGLLKKKNYSFDFN